jgi:uncharacterized membrane protein
LRQRAVLRMNLLYAPVGLDLALLGWALLVPALWLALRTLRGGFLPDGAQQHAWLAGLVCVALVWTLQVRLGNGPGLGLLGVALYVLLFGAARGMLGLLLALVLHHLLAGGSWLALGASGLLFAVLPALLTSALQRAVARWLPNNLLIFIIGNGLFVTLAATALTSLTLLLLSVGLAEPSPMAASVAPAVQLTDYIGYSLLLAWGEALVSGMIFSALVVFTPRIVLTYRQDLYLPRRGTRR